MTLSNCTKIAAAAFLLALSLGCGSNDPMPIPNGGSGGTLTSQAGGATASGGAIGNSGATASGGNQAATGGATAAGGSDPSVGGGATSGGAPNTGGTTASIGGSATGGKATGGTTTAGGSITTTGGAKATGGTTTAGGSATTTGGTATTGGNTNAGGKATGGAVATTGGKATGGTAAAAGGVTTTGGTTGTGGTAVTFRNPLNTSHGSDPFMTYYDGKYYLAATTWGTTLTMKSGATVAALKAATPSVIWTDSTASRSGNMWAPEFYLMDNGSGAQRWYHYYTAGDGSDLGTQRPYVLESDGTDPMGPYHFKAQLLTYWAIDHSILRVGAQLYLMFSAWQGSTQNIWIQAMTNPWTVTGTRTQLSAPTYAWEQEGSDSVNEGPVALYHGARTFVTYSASQCASPGYKLGLLELVASNPLAASSWTKSAPAVFQSGNGNYGTGHNGFFTSPDGTENWIVYHGVPNSAGSCWTDRTTRIQKFTWNADGTPNFGSPLALTTNIVVPSGE